MSLLSARDLTYIYSQKTPFEHKAVDSVSFDIERGDFIGIIGHTGSAASASRSVWFSSIRSISFLKKRSRRT